MARVSRWREAARFAFFVLGIFSTTRCSLYDVVHPTDPSEVINKGAKDEALKEGALSGLLKWRNSNPRADLVLMAISGGGVKSATFAGETMFYLDWVGLLRKVNLISSVSGGGFPAARFVLSCDPNAASTPACETADKKTPRPQWDYASTMDILTRPLGTIKSQIKWGVVPFSPRSSSWPSRGFADLVNERYLQPETGGPYHYTLADLEGHNRPRLAINATVISDDRPLIENTEGRGYLRRRTRDEYYHFAFTSYYLSAVGSDYRQIRLEDAVGASAAFPVAINYFRLADCSSGHCLSDKTRQVALTDGGANDNQGLIEIYHTIGELMNHEARSPASASKLHKDHCAGDLECIRPGDKVLILSINSAISAATGGSGAALGGFGLERNINRTLRASDVYAGTEMDLRDRLYRQALDEANKEAIAEKWPTKPLRATEIGLLMLDRYREGGATASVIRRSGIEIPKDGTGCDTPGYDKNACELAAPYPTQRKAYDTVVRNRKELQLGNTHPQCLFEQARATDESSLDAPDKDTVTCLRFAARWATALRMQELCMAAQDRRDGPPLNDMGNVRCQGEKLQSGLSLPGEAKQNEPRLQPPPNSFEAFASKSSCSFSPTKEEPNRNILDHLRQNSAFRSELTEQGRPEAAEDLLKAATLTERDVSKKLNDICNLDKIYPQPAK